MANAAAGRLSAALADRYRIERELGQGGMATVYLAEDLKHRRRVAVKVLKPELAAVLGADRFVQEITTTAALQHPHILPLFDSGTADGFLYYVMPYVEGETLRAKLDRETQLGIDEAVRIAREVADALDYAHRHHVIHRDIKPENILLHDGRPIVADFGIALAVSAAAGGRMTETGLSLGTPHYMSPEQATAEKDLTNRSDIYSLGSVLYEMLTGNPPHTGASAQQIIMKIVTAEAAPVTTLRRSVPANVSAAVAKSLEKVPADRFESAKAFAEALANPTYTTMRTAVHGAAAGERRWSRDPRTIATAAIAAIASLTLVWALTRPAPADGPAEYDVGLPDSAAMHTIGGVGFSVAPAGDFVVYHAGSRVSGGLWYRSLRDAAVRPINGTEYGRQSAVSPDGSRVAFLRFRNGSAWTLETVSIQGGASAVIGRGTGHAELAWLPDGRLQVVELDGNRARWFDPGGGPSTEQAIGYCMMPSLLPDATRLLCGGGGDMAARLVGVGDSSGLDAPIFTGAVADSTRVLGSNFRVIDGRYLVYLSRTADLLATSIDLATRRAGRPVRMIDGIGRREYLGAGTYAVSSTGTLVYAQGINRAVGHLVAMDERSVDTLNVGREAFLKFALSPDGQRLAATVDGFDGEELRVYDLRTGGHVVLAKHFQVMLPVWSARGDRLMFGAGGAIYTGSPDQSGAPERVFQRKATEIEPYAWLPDGRIIADLWTEVRIVVVDPTRTPPSLDTLAKAAAFPHLSPDGRWLSYNSIGLDALWLQPFPADGKRYQVATGYIEDSQWLSPTELTMTVWGDTLPAFDRVTLDLSAATPTFQRRRWLVPPEFITTAGQSYTLTRDGRLVYIRGSPERAVQYLRVIPNWVTRMKRAVDEANR